MPDTGAPWNIPFLDGTELVRAYPDFSEDLADAVADGLSAAGGLVAVKSATKTDTFSASVTGGDNVAVTDLSITHALADAGNKLIISAFFGTSGNSGGSGRVGIGIHDGSGLIAIGDADGSRSRVTAGTRGVDEIALSIMYVHSPGDLTERTYTVRAILCDTATRTVFINKNAGDANSLFNMRTASGFVIQEVKV